MIKLKFIKITQLHNTLMEAVGTRNLEHFLYEDQWEKPRCAKHGRFQKRHTNPNR